jgi:hypothetical protein
MDTSPPCPGLNTVRHSIFQEVYCPLPPQVLTRVGQGPFPLGGGRTGWGERSAAFTPTHTLPHPGGGTVLGVQAGSIPTLVNPSGGGRLGWGEKLGISAVPMLTATPPSHVEGKGTEQRHTAPFAPNNIGPPPRVGKVRLGMELLCTGVSPAGLIAVSPPASAFFSCWKNKDLYNKLSAS